jgi:translocon-associated protein subunit beta
MKSTECSQLTISRGSNVSHSVILRPTKSGYFNFTSAEISYMASEESSERTVGYTSGPGEGGIMNFRDYDRKFSPHVVSAILFF